MSLQDKAMLANLTVRAWSARKRDKDVGDEVEKAHNAKDAGNFNKLLIDKEYLKTLVKLSGKLRDTHYNMTLPWGDNGDRLLPSKMYFDYCKVMRTVRDEFETATKEFCKGYPVFVQAARKRLGTMYDPANYPDVSVIGKKFSAELSFLPVPNASDFRVDLNADEVDTIKKDIERQVAKQQEAAINDLWGRLKDVTTKIHERLSDPDAIFRDSLIDNANFTAEMAIKLNLYDDGQVEEDLQSEFVKHELMNTICTDIINLCKIAPQRLRDDPVLRERMAKAAWTIIQKFPTA